jgi:2-furoyl-CoA dehydrogenase FAD binding subunit
MKPVRFDYVRADTLSEAVALLAEHGEDARILAGGQSLMAVLNIRLAAPRLLIDVSRAADLDYSRVNKGYLEVGAAATQASVEWRPGLADEVPLLKLAFPLISHFQIRNKGTVCGSIAHADPSAELPLCLTALEGEVVLRAKSGQRVVKAEDFFQGMLMTARRPDEVVEAVRFPLRRPSARYAFDEVSMRHGDFALVAIAVGVSADGIALAVGGVADRPVLHRWPKLEGADLDAALNDFAWELDAQDDHHASAQYRRHLVRKMGRRLIEEAA